jgi:Lipid A core - O-antigen ligase and related enzymes
MRNPGNKFMLKFDSQYLRWFFLMLCFFKTSAIDQNFLLGTIFDVGRVIASTIILVKYLSKSKFSKFIILVTIYEILLLLSTVLANGETFTALISLISVTAMCMFVEYAAKMNYAKCIKVLLHISCLFLFLNAILQVMYPKGLYTVELTRDWGRMYWLYGHQNQMTPYTILTLTLFFLHKEINNQSKFDMSTVIVLGTVIWSALVAWSATNLLCSFLFVSLYSFCSVKNRPFFSFKTCLFLQLVIFLSIIIFRLQDAFQWLVEGVLQRTLTFTGRTNIWDSALLAIQENPVLGQGVQNEETMMRIMRLVHAHNAYLQVVFASGFVGLGIFLAILATYALRIDKNRASSQSRPLVIGLFALMLGMQMDVYRFDLFFMLLAIAANMHPTLIRRRRSML